MPEFFNKPSNKPPGMRQMRPQTTEHLDFNGYLRAPT